MMDSGEYDHERGLGPPLDHPPAWLVTAAALGVIVAVGAFLFYVLS